MAPPSTRESFKLVLPMSKTTIAMALGRQRAASVAVAANSFMVRPPVHRFFVWPKAASLRDRSRLQRMRYDDLYSGIGQHLMRAGFDAVVGDDGADAVQRAEDEAAAVAKLA